MNITGVIDVRNAFVCWITVAVVIDVIIVVVDVALNIAVAGILPCVWNLPVVIDVIIVVVFGGVAVLLVVRGSYYYC